MYCRTIILKMNNWSDLKTTISITEYRRLLNKRLKNLKITEDDLYYNFILPLANGGTGQSLSNPGADRLLFWDNSESKIDWLSLGNSISITGTTIDTIQDIRTTANPTWNNITGTGYLKGVTAQIGNVAGGHYLEVESDGTIHMQGNATTYEDLTIPMSTGHIPVASFPTWAGFTTNTNAYIFAVNDYIDLANPELTHSYKLATDCEIHLHWATQGTDATDRYVKWACNVATGVKDGQFYELTYSQETMIPANTPTHTAMYTSLGTISGSGFGVGTIFVIRAKRIASTGTAPTSNPFGLNVGIHFNQDTIGSRQMLTK